MQTVPFYTFEFGISFVAAELFFSRKEPKALALRGFTIVVDCIVLSVEPTFFLLDSTTQVVSRK
jgi:hypothetical protein